MHSFFTSIIVFISIVFFNSKRDKMEAVYKASWIRTVVYLILSFIMLTVLLKIHEMPHMANVVRIEAYEYARERASGENFPPGIQIDTVYSSEDTFAQHRILDSVSIAIDNICTNTDLLYIGAKKGTRRGCIKNTFDFCSDSSFILNRRSGFDYSSIPDTAKQKYLVTTGMKSVPSLTVFTHIQSNPEESNLLTYNTSVIKHLSDSLSNKYLIPHELEVLGKHSGMFACFVDPSFEAVIMNDKLANRLHLLTAADISQCVYTVIINSDCPLKDFSVNFDIPVEITPLTDGYKQGVYGFSVTDSATLKQLSHNTMQYYMKFPTLANQQLLRSMVVTTLLTAFATLFLTNLYYIFCLYIMVYRTKRRNRSVRDDSHRLSIGNYRKFWRIINCVLSVTGILIVVYFALIFAGERIYYYAPSYYYDCFIIAYCVCAILIIVLSYVRLFRNSQRK